MEDRKQAEIKYYNQEAQSAAVGKKEAGSLAKVDPFLLGSYRWLKGFFKEGYTGKSVLDYGCGMGVHLPWLAENFRNVTGIDLSETSLVRANEIIRENGLQNKVATLIGDCEKMDFSNESFDVVFDGGTFSSLELDNALREIHRVLKPGGLLVGIETLGHNPFTNAKRKLNILLGKRTSWAGDHIFKMQSLEVVKKYFNIKELRFFHLTSWAAFPFLRYSGGKLFLKLLEKLDHFLINICPFLKKYSFKIVFVLTKR